MRRRVDQILRSSRAEKNNPTPRSWPNRPRTPRLSLACRKCDFTARRGRERRPLADALFRCLPHPLESLRSQPADVPVKQCSYACMRRAWGFQLGFTQPCSGGNPSHPTLRKEDRCGSPFISNTGERLFSKDFPHSPSLAGIQWSNASSQKILTAHRWQDQWANASSQNS